MTSPDPKPAVDRALALLHLLDDEEAEVTEFDVRPVVKDLLAELELACAAGGVERQERQDLEACLGRIRATCEAAGVPGQTREPDPAHPDDRTEDITTKWATDKLVERLAAKLAEAESRALSRLVDRDAPLSSRETRLFRVVMDIGDALGLPRPVFTTLDEVEAYIGQVLGRAISLPVQLAALRASSAVTSDQLADARAAHQRIRAACATVGLTEAEPVDALVERMAGQLAGERINVRDYREATVRHHERMRRARDVLDEVLNNPANSPWNAMRRALAILDGSEA